jgi:hypothetical protein
MPTSPMTHGTVKSTLDGLEISPSAKQASSAIYNSGSQPTAAKHSPKHAAGTKGTMTNKESDFKKK